MVSLFKNSAMKRILPFILLTSFALLTINSFAQSEENAESERYDVLDIGGTISHGEDMIEGVSVKLYESNNVVDDITTKKNGKFKFTLLSNYIYTIELSKKGYYSKKVSVNTRIPAEVDDTYKFLFDLSMDSKEEKTLDKYLADYPAVLIEYSAKKDEFTFDKKYTETYFEEIEVTKN